MALDIKDPEKATLEDSRARPVVGSERVRRLGAGLSDGESLLADLRDIRERVARLPELDSRSAEDIMGYDEHGVPR